MRSVGKWKFRSLRGTGRHSDPGEQPIASTTGWLFVTQGRTFDMFRWGLIGSTLTVASIIVGLPWGVVGVAASYQQRGIGTALLRHAFVEYHRRGMPRVSLGVDAENPSGATRVYERAGMRVVAEDVVFEKDLA